MLSSESPDFRQAVEETAAWCALLSVGRQLVDEEVAAQRRTANQEAYRLIGKARRKADRGWFRRKLADTKEWHRASDLLKRIHDFLNPLRHNFRTPALKPDSILTLPRPTRLGTVQSLRLSQSDWPA